jgi:hypothetical protein
LFGRPAVFSVSEKEKVGKIKWLTVDGIVSPCMWKMKFVACEQGTEIRVGSKEDKACTDQNQYILVYIHM